MAAIIGGGQTPVTREEFEVLSATLKQQNERQNQQAEQIRALLVGDLLANAALRSANAYNIDADRALKEQEAKSKALIKAGTITLLSVAKTSIKVGLVVAKAGEGAFKLGIKKLPGVGMIFGAVLAVVRIASGDHWVLALGEVASGVASCFPGIGTAISLGIDGYLLANDGIALYKARSQQVEQPTRQGGIENLEQAYGCLGIKPEEGEPTKAQVDKLYRELMLQYHPDKAANLGLGDVIKAKFASFALCLTAARDFIYRTHGW